jgi:hypothetical protein
VKTQPNEIPEAVVGGIPINGWLCRIMLEAGGHWSVAYLRVSGVHVREGCLPKRVAHPIGDADSIAVAVD